MIHALSMHWHSAAIWLISLGSIALVLIRPKGWPEAWWAAAGACLLVLCRLLSPVAAFHAIGKGVDVYLFLTGMMVMSELARREGVFDWVAGACCADIQRFLQPSVRSGLQRRRACNCLSLE